MSRRVIALVTAAASLIVALLGLRPLPATSASPDSPPEPLEWLALGDSYSSGEGVFDDTGDCQRSAYAWANAAARTVAKDGYLADMPDLLACTGAQTTDAGESVDFDEQLVRADEDGYPIVTYTIGGNDIGFADIVQDCMGFDDDIWKGWPINHGCDITETEITERVHQLEADLNETYGQVADLVQREGGHVIVLGYPILLEDPTQWADGGLPHTCELIQRDDAWMLRRIGRRLNDAIRAATERWPNFHYVDVAPGFDGHSLCSDAQAEDEWINGISLDVTGWDSVLPDIDKSDSLHPNYYGHAYEGRLVAETVAGLDWSELADSGTEGSGEPLAKGAGYYLWYVADHNKQCIGANESCIRAAWQGQFKIDDGNVDAPNVIGEGRFNELDAIDVETHGLVGSGGVVCASPEISVEQSVDVGGTWNEDGLSLRFEPSASVIERPPITNTPADRCVIEDHLRWLSRRVKQYVDVGVLGISTDQEESWQEIDGDIYRVGVIACAAEQCPPWPLNR